MTLSKNHTGEGLLSQQHLISRLFSCVSLIVVMLFVGMQGAYASQGGDIVGAVFVATNDSVANGVLMFQQHPDGLLTPVAGSPFLTQGQGTGTGIEFSEDPIGSQNSLIVDKDNKFLFVVNTGSNEVSVFKIHHNRLTLVETVPSDGFFPVSLALHDNILYVLNAAGNINFTGYKVAKDGHLKPLKCSQCYLLPPLNQWQIIEAGQPEITETPGQIGFSPDGKQLIIIRKEGLASSDFSGPIAGPGHIDVYEIDKSGLPVNCKHPTSTISQKGVLGRFPFAFVFSKQGDLVVTEVFGSSSYESTPFGAGAVSSYKLKSNGELKVITSSLPSTSTMTSRNARTGNFVYTANNLDNSISLYKVNNNGTLQLLNAKAAVLETSDPSYPLDLAISTDGRFLYQLSEGVTAEIYTYLINQLDGSLTLLGTVSVGDSFSGQAGLAVANF